MRRHVALATVCLSAAVPGLTLWFTDATDAVAVGPVMQVTGGLAVVLLVASLCAAPGAATRPGRVLYRSRAVTSVAGLAATLLHLVLAEAVPQDTVVAAAGLAPVAALLAGLSLSVLAPAMAASRRWMRATLGTPWCVIPLASVTGAVLLALHGAMSLDGEGAAWAWLHMLPLLVVPAVPLLRSRAGKADAWG